MEKGRKFIQCKNRIFRNDALCIVFCISVYNSLKVNKIVSFLIQEQINIGELFLSCQSSDFRDFSFCKILFQTL